MKVLTVTSSKEHARKAQATCSEKRRNAGASKGRGGRTGLGGGDAGGYGRVVPIQALL